jgi:hypothetical protein
MERVRFIRHRDKEILFLDFSACKAGEVLLVIDKAKPVIAARPEKSLLTLSDVTNARFDDTVSQRMKEFTVHNKPFVKAAAVVGITGLKKIVFEAVMLFSQRKLHAFETIEQAKDWLAAQ